MATENPSRPAPLSIRPDLDALPAYVPGKSAPGAIKLASNEIVDGPLPSVAAALADVLRSANRYPDNGAVALKAELAKLTGVTEEQLHAGCGSVALCQDLVQVTCRPGDEVIFAWRSFEAYPIVTRVVGATPVQVPLTADHAHDLDAMAAAITDRTRLIFVCNPNNPTGTTVSEEALEAFLQTVPPHVIVALDEAYYEYHRPNEQTGDRIDGAALISRHRNVIALRTFSKAYGLAGLRVGYAMADPELIAALTKVHLPFSVSVPAQAAAIASLHANDELLARTEAVVAERVRVREALLEAGFEVPHTQANFVWLPLGADALRFTADAAEAGLLVRELRRCRRPRHRHRAGGERRLPRLRDGVVAVSLGKHEFAFTAHVPVRWSDMDALGHVNHARMVTLLEEARIQWLLSAGEKYAPLIKSAFIADVAIKYKAQLYHEDSPVQVGMYIASNRTVDFTLGYEVRANGAAPESKPAILATTQMAVVDIEKRSLRRLTDEEKSYLASWSRG